MLPCGGAAQMHIVRQSKKPDLAVGVGKVLFRWENLAFLPAILMAWVWYGSQGILLFVAAVLPLAFILSRQRQPLDYQEIVRDGETGLPLRTEAEAALTAALLARGATGKSTAALVIGIDDAEALTARHGSLAFAGIIRQTADRLGSVLRATDVAVRIDGASFGVALDPVRRTNLESVLQLAARVQAAVESPLSIDAATIYVRASVGFCLAGQMTSTDGAAMLSAAVVAMQEARRAGTGSIRAFSPEIGAAVAAREMLHDEVEAALEGGQIVPFFQPQIATDSGLISGFAALARWVHPTRGPLDADEFLRAVEAGGLSARLTEVMLYHALAAMRSWQRAGLSVPAVAVNFDRSDLSDPALPDRIKWELDRFELAPSRLIVEVLESVVAETGNDVITRNLAALSELGCGIDLDDFGTGHASILNIRRFGVDRIKIDRSFVAQLDSDPKQQEMVAAILSLTERLGLVAIADGVETTSEHAMLAQLGCGHVQGFGVARPMPFEETLDWMDRYRAKLAKTQTETRWAR